MRYFQYSYRKEQTTKKNKPFFKINPCYRCVELYLFQNCPFKLKNAILAGAKDKNSHAADLEGEIIKKKKNPKKPGH